MKNKLPKPPGVTPLRDEDRMPVVRVVSGDTWTIDAELRSGRNPASPENCNVEFVLSENQFSPPIWTGEWVNGIIPDRNRPGLVHVEVPREVTRALRRGSYMFSIRVSDRTRFLYGTQLLGYFLVEYLPTSDQHSIPYRDGTSEIFCGGGTSDSGGSSSQQQDEGLEDQVDELKRQTREMMRRLSEMSARLYGMDVRLDSVGETASKASTDAESAQSAASQAATAAASAQNTAASAQNTASQAATAAASAQNTASAAATAAESASSKAQSALDTMAKPYPFTVVSVSGGELSVDPFKTNILDLSSASPAVEGFSVSVTASPGNMRDLFLNVIAGETAAEITWPEGTVPANGDPDNLVMETGATTMFLVTEYEAGAGRFIVARQVISQ